MTNENKLPHEILADELKAIGLHGMAERALRFEYHDFKSEHEMPDFMLLNELKDAFAHGCFGAWNIMQRHKDGKYDATLEESNEWFKSEVKRAEEEGDENYLRLLNAMDGSGETE